VIFKPFLQLPGDTDAFRMQTGVSQRGGVSPSLQLTRPIEEDQLSD
jgi:hypothetical protein